MICLLYFDFLTKFCSVKFVNSVNSPSLALSALGGNSTITAFSRESVVSMAFSTIANVSLAVLKASLFCSSVSRLSIFFILFDGVNTIKLLYDLSFSRLGTRSARLLSGKWAPGQSRVVVYALPSRGLEAAGFLSLFPFRRLSICLLLTDFTWLSPTRRAQSCVGCFAAMCLVNSALLLKSVVQFLQLYFS